MTEPKQRARRPVSGDAGPWEGRRASPSNPNQPLRGAKNALTEKMDIRCTVEEKQVTREKAALAGLPISALLREQLGLAQPHRRKLVEKVDEQQFREIVRCCKVLDEIAQDMKTAKKQQAFDNTVALGMMVALVELRRSLDFASIGRAKFRS